ncbi:MAG: polyprenol monophosphomannose synthase [Catenulispora sp.]|nr:polyprenol monophosphomannose synthase [Catenulispora sp.]
MPTYCERENLPEIVGQLLKVELSRELCVLVVDDNSPDGTGDVAEELAAQEPERMSVLHRTAKDGLGRAYLAGFQRALDNGADIVIQMDADLSHPVDAIPAMIDAMDEHGAGVVLGSRYVRGGRVADEWPWHRKALSAWANFYVRMILRIPVKDATAGFKAWRADVLRSLDLGTLASNGYAFQVEMNHRAMRQGYRMVEVPITFTERHAGASKMSVRVQVESALMPWRLRFRRR